MPVKHSNNFMRCIILPLAVCAMMFSARCSDDGSEELTQQALLSLVSCKGGTMSFTIDGAPRTWTCCVAVNHGSYWEVVGSGGGEVVRLFIGDGNPANSPFNDSELSSYQYIQFNSFFGVIDGAYDGTSSITVSSNDADSIIGNFTGTVCLEDNGATCHAIASTVDFTALK